MKLEWLRYFMEIAATGSLNKAADNLYLSQPALTKTIRALETEIGETLLYRKKTGVFLTAQGEVFLDFAQNVMADYQDYLTKKFSLQNNDQQYEGTIELVMSSSILQLHYHDIVTHLGETFPQIKFYCIEADMEAATELLTDDVSRLGVVACTLDDTIQIWKKLGIVHREICRSDVVCCVSSSSHYSGQSYIHQDDIIAEKFISIEFAKKSFSRFNNGICGIRTTNLDMIKQILLTEKDACVMTSLQIAEQKLLSAEIMALPIVPTITTATCLIYNQRALEQSIYPPQFFQTVEDIVRQCIV